MEDIVQPSITIADREIAKEIQKETTEIEKDCHHNEGVKSVTLTNQVAGAVMQLFAENRVLMNWFVKSG